MAKAIDAHAHILPQSFIDLIKKDRRFMAEFVEKDENTKFIQFDGGFVHAYNRTSVDPEEILKHMDKNDIACHALSVSPRLFYYYAPKEIACEVARICNDEIYSITDKYKGRFIGMGTVPMQDVDLAVKELRRMKNELNFNAVEIGSEVNDKKLSDPYFLPFFEEAANNDMFILIHPQAIGRIQFMEDYYLGTILGHPFYTTIAAANLVLSGIFDKLPNLKIGLSHGGGYLPYQLGRLEHGFKVRKEMKVNIKESPTIYIKDHLYFDTITHSIEAFEFLVKVIGADNIIMGTDYPFDMCEMSPVSMIRRSNIKQEDKDKILYRNARRLFRLEDND